MDYVLIDGDQAIFQPTFGAATVAVVGRPGTLKASGPGTVGQKAMCVEGDEASVSVPGCMYVTPQYSIPGVGTLEIAALAGDQTATKTKTGGKLVLLVGSNFDAKFKVSSPAKQPVPGSSPVPDATPEYSGRGNFITQNSKYRGT